MAECGKRGYVGTWAYVPAKFERPYSTGPRAGRCIDPAYLNEILDAFYERQGWDERGIVTDVTLEGLGIVPPQLVRLCVGGEHPDDVIADPSQALDAIRSITRKEHAHESQTRHRGVRRRRSGFGQTSD